VQLRRYNKLLASDGGEGAAPGGGAVEACYDPYEDVYQGEDADEQPGGPLPQPPPGAPLAQPAKRQRKKFNALQVLAQQKAAEREQALRAAAEAQALAAQRRAQQQAAQQARKAASEGMRKRNSKGQPIMKYRVDNILAKLQHEARQKQSR
jgi:flagellar biosynthesis/type III secretory pathway protein FliH